MSAAAVMFDYSVAHGAYVYTPGATMYCHQHTSPATCCALYNANAVLACRYCMGTNAFCKMTSLPVN